MPNVVQHQRRPSKTPGSAASPLTMKPLGPEGSAVSLFRWNSSNRKSAPNATSIRAEFDRATLDGTFVQRLSAACGPVRLRAHGRNVVTRSVQRIERGHGEVRRAGENDAQPISYLLLRHGARRARRQMTETLDRSAPGTGRRPVATLLLELLANARALELREVVDEQLALQVIHFVLDADGEQAMASISNGRPSRPSARTTMRAERVLSLSKMPGTDRQPSSASVLPSRSMISGLTKTIGWSAPWRRRRRGRAGARSPGSAARPTPGAAYMVSSMSSISRRTRSSTVATGTARVRSRGSGYSRMVSFAILLKMLLKLSNAWI